jgi:hypothetical protein
LFLFSGYKNIKINQYNRTIISNEFHYNLLYHCKDKNNTFKSSTNIVTLIRIERILKKYFIQQKQQIITAIKNISIICSRCNQLIIFSPKILK